MNLKICNYIEDNYRIGYENIEQLQNIETMQLGLSWLGKDCKEVPPKNVLIVINISNIIQCIYNNILKAPYFSIPSLLAK